MFKLTKDETELLRSQFATLEKIDMRGKHAKFLPYAFTENGIAMQGLIVPYSALMIDLSFW